MSTVTELIPLGTNGFYPSYHRQTMSFLLLGSDRAVLLDAGTGTGRLGEPSIRHRLEGIERLDIVLSHYHFDHVVGLTYLGTAWQRPVRIVAPGPPLVDSSPQTAFDQLFAPPLLVPLCELPITVEVETYSDDFEVAGLQFRVRRQQHPGGSVGMRIGDQLAYVTDTVADPETVALSLGVKLLLHDSWADDERARADPRLISAHATVGAAIDIAERAQVGALALIHHHPRRGEAALEQLIAEAEQRSRVPIVRLIEGVAHAF